MERAETLNANNSVSVRRTQRDAIDRMQQGMLYRWTSELTQKFCVVDGDNTYKSIAAASILAKTHRDNYIYELVKNNPDLEKYGLHKHKGYGTKIHMDALREHGPVEGHRLSFKPCH